MYFHQFLWLARVVFLSSFISLVSKLSFKPYLILCVLLVQFIASRLQRALAEIREAVEYSHNHICIQMCKVSVLELSKVQIILPLFFFRAFFHYRQIKPMQPKLTPKKNFFNYARTFQIGFMWFTEIYHPPKIKIKMNFYPATWV